LKANDCQPFTSGRAHGKKELRGKIRPNVLSRALQVVKLPFKGKSDFIRTKEQKLKSAPKAKSSGSRRNK
jgi:hypothetical protein